MPYACDAFGVFFFSSRRRHTSLSGDWSSDVCSSDLCGPSFVINDKGDIRANDWEFNAWGGLVDGLYFPWDQDELVARKIAEVEGIDTYKTENFVLEGGSFHIDGQGTVLTTEMCLLSEGRNP